MNIIHETYKKGLAIGSSSKVYHIITFYSSAEVKDLVSDHVNLAFKKFVLEGLLDMVSLTHQEVAMESYVLSKYQTLQEGNRR